MARSSTMRLLLANHPGASDNTGRMRFPRLRTRGFLALSAVLVAAAVVLAGWLTGAFFERRLLRYEEDHAATVVLNQARQHLTARHFEAGSPAAREGFQEFMQGLPGVFRVKAFDPAGLIVWSNEERLIGQVFPENAYLKAALAGRLTTVIEEPRRAEHVFERDRGYVAEAYVPIAFIEGTAPSGIVETYRDMTDVMQDLAQARRTIWSVGAAIGALLYTALVLVVRQAAAGELRAITQLERQNQELAALQGFSQSVLGPMELAGLGQRIVESAGRGLGLSRTALYRSGGDGALTLLAAWPDRLRPAEAPRPVAQDALARREGIERAPLLAIPIFTQKGTAHLFIAETVGAPGSRDPLDRGTLDIMLREASVALANVELFGEIREAHERLAAILAGIADRLVIIDRDMRVAWMNDAAAAELGAGAIGRACFELAGASPEACEGCPALRTMQTGRVEHGVRSERSPSGRTVYFDLIAAPLRDASGQVDRVIEVSRDITELVEMEERLKHANRELLDAQALLIEKERLAAIGQVVVGLHHAILNPVAGALGALQVLRQADRDRPERVEALAAAEAEMRKIEALVKRLPDLRRADDAPYVGGTTMVDFTRAWPPDTPTPSREHRP